MTDTTAPTAPASTVRPDPNARFLVLAYGLDGNTRRVYLLNPGDTFAGFGGSRHGLTVRKTASMIVSDIGPMGRRDVEHNVNDATMWAYIRRGLALCNGVTLPQDADVQATIDEG